MATSTSRAILRGIGVLGPLAVLLSGLPWIRYEWIKYEFLGYASHSVYGYDFEGLTGIGDGWVTGVAASVATAIALAALVRNRSGQLVGAAIVACGLVITGITSYDLLKPWSSPAPNVPYLDFSQTASQASRQPALWALAAIGVAVAIAGLALFRRQARSEPEPAEVAEAWA